MSARWTKICRCQDCNHACDIRKINTTGSGILKDCPLPLLREIPKVKALIHAGQRIRRVAEWSVDKDTEGAIYTWDKAIKPFEEEK